MHPLSPPATPDHVEAYWLAHICICALKFAWRKFIKKRFLVKLDSSPKLKAILNNTSANGEVVGTVTVRAFPKQNVHAPIKPSIVHIGTGHQW